MAAWSKPHVVLLAVALTASVLVHGQIPKTGSLPDAPDTAPYPGSVQNQPAHTLDASSPDVTDSSSASSSAILDASIKSPKPFLHRVVPAGDGPQPLTSTQKFEMSFRSRVGLGAIGSSIFGAGERQLFNSRPHYGTDSGAFGERLGAAELKQVTESFFSYGLYASAFHEDPHYYVMGPGPGHGIMHRAVYSATRVVLTRTDDGGTGVNWAKLAGMGSATALTNTYYPPQDRGFHQTMSAYGASLATSALTLELHEFLPDVMHAVLHRKRASE